MTTSEIVQLLDATINRISDTYENEDMALIDKLLELKTLVEKFWG